MSILLRARETWKHLAEQGLLCPPGWEGIVVLGDEAITTGPIGEALTGLPVHEWTDPVAVAKRQPVVEVLGPAALAFTETPPPGPELETLPADHDDVLALVASVPADEAGEAALDDLTSAAFVLRDGGRVVAAAGYERWPYDVAHLSVLTAPDRRGRGLARTVGAAATRDALVNGLFPQWRARPQASRRVARALGFQELGAQLSVRL